MLVYKTTSLSAILCTVGTLRGKAILFKDLHYLNKLNPDALALPSPSWNQVKFQSTEWVDDDISRLTQRAVIVHKGLSYIRC